MASAQKRAISSGERISLSTAEFRRALLQEGRDAFARVGRGAREPLQIAFQIELLGERVVGGGAIAFFVSPMA